MPGKLRHCAAAAAPLFYCQLSWLGNRASGPPRQLYTPVQPVPPFVCCCLAGRLPPAPALQSDASLKCIHAPPRHCPCIFWWLPNSALLYRRIVTTDSTADKPLSRRCLHRSRQDWFLLAYAVPPPNLLERPSASE